jgi:sterol desaturase/sphingolipid hydroxylase (fatty acid hydroxylase superfamily)
MLFGVTWVGDAAMFVVLAPLLAVAEWANPEPGTSSGARPPLRRRRTDWAFVALQLALVPAVAACITHWGPVLSAQGPWRGAAASLPLPVAALAAFLVADLVAYWLHRAEHHFCYMWRFHSVHHSARQLDWLSGRRFHPADVVLQQLVPVAAVAAIGVPLPALVPYFFVAGLVTLLAHCNIAVPGRWLRRVVVTPSYHRSHHESERDGSNFALVLPLMDMLFGTASFHLGPRSFGTAEHAPGTGFFSLLGWGFGWRGRAQRASTNSPTQKDTALAT